METPPGQNNKTNNLPNNLPDKSQDDTHPTTPRAPETIAQVQHFSGPLPPPSILRQYEDVAPGSAGRLIDKFEQQTDHRIRMEDRLVWVAAIKEIGGLIFGFIIAITAIVGGIYSALQGHPFLGGSLSFAGLALLVGAFLANTYGASEQKEDKDAAAKDASAS